MLCSGNHSRKDCPVRDANLYKCANCKGPHTANSPECRFIKQAKEIEKVRAYQNKTYVEARNTVIKQSKPNNSGSNNLTSVIRNYIESDTHDQNPRQMSYRDAVQSVDKQQVIQTEPRNNQPSEAVQIKLPDIKELFHDKLKQCLNIILEKFTLKNLTDNANDIIEGALKQAFTGGETTGMENGKRKLTDSTGDLMQEEQDSKREKSDNVERLRPVNVDKRKEDVAVPNHGSQEIKVNKHKKDQVFEGFPPVSANPSSSRSQSRTMQNPKLDSTPKNNKSSTKKKVK